MCARNLGRLALGQLQRTQTAKETKQQTDDATEHLLDGGGTAELGHAAAASCCSTRCLMYWAIPVNLTCGWLDSLAEDGGQIEKATPKRESCC
jgi:hypothetical protein